MRLKNKGERIACTGKLGLNGAKPSRGRMGITRLRPDLPAIFFLLVLHATTHYTLLFYSTTFIYRLYIPLLYTTFIYYFYNKSK